MTPPATFYWHDYETWGASPALDRPAQFAGIRTDGDLRETGEPLDILCRLPEDYLPHPIACLIHRITPQRAQADGLPEPAFVARIHAELARPGTCGVGYNSLRFDDEVTRHALYRNFYDPYERESRNGNSRWDLIDVMRLARLLRPEGLAWPDVDGKPSFRLEALTRANGIEHTGAHDALADVRATIALARRLKAAQPKLFDWALKARSKDWVFGQLPLDEPKPVLHVSSRFPAEQGSAALVLPLLAHPRNRNSVIACNLTMDPAPLAELDAATLRARLYTRSEDLPPGASRAPLKEIHVNKCPMLAPDHMLTPEIAARCGIDLGQCRDNAKRILAMRGLADKLRAVYVAPGDWGPPVDPEAALYGGFAPDRDKALFPALRSAGASELAPGSFVFEDPRLAELLFRYRARHFPHCLSDDERTEWREHCRRRLHGEPPKGLLGCAGFAAELAAARERSVGDAAPLALLDAVEDYGNSLCGCA